MNTDPTVEIIRNAADTLERAAADLRLKAEQLEESDDFTLVGECVNTIANIFLNIRLDLFVIRPLREYQRKGSNT